MSLNVLLEKICRLSKSEREFISQSSILDWMPDNKIPRNRLEEISFMKKLVLNFNAKSFHLLYE